MANFKYYENDYELAVLQMLEQGGWEYQCGYDIHRTNDEVILGGRGKVCVNDKKREYKKYRLSQEWE